MKILVSKPDALGDQILATAFIQALLRKWPEARIVWHVRSGMEVIAEVVEGASVFRLDPSASPEAEAARMWSESSAAVLVVPYSIHPFSNWEPDLAARYEWWGRFLSATRWDIATAPVVNRTALSDFSVTISNAARRLVFAANKACQPLIEAVFSHLPENKTSFTDEVPSSLDNSEWTHYQALLTAVAPGEALQSPVLRISPDAERKTEEVLGEAGAPLVLLAPGVGEHAQRAWAMSNFLRLADGLRSRGNHVYWVEGPGDAAYFAQPPDMDAQPRLRIESGEVGVLAAAIRRTRLLVCNDTAYVHLAAALNAPTVAIFGAGQKGRFVPRFGRVRAVQGDPHCRGCQWQCAFHQYICVQDVPFETVWSAVAAQIEEPAAAHEKQPIPLPLTPPRDAAGELEWARDWFQQELNFLRWDGWARLQIINDVIERLKSRDGRIAELTREREALGARPAEAEHPVDQATIQRPLPRLSLIIPMGRPERADGTLRSLARQTLRPPWWEVVVVGVGVSDITGRYPELPLVPVDLPHNLLPPHTRAEGVKRATGEWYIFVDDDVQLAPDFFEMLARILAAPVSSPAQTLPPVGAIGVRLPGGRGTFFEHLTDISNFWSQQSPIRAVPHTVWYLYSAAIVIRAEAYHRAGGFNIELPNGEDVDLTQRITAAGYILAYEPSLLAWHHHGRDSLLRMWRYFWRNGNAAQYFFAHFGGVCCYSIRTVVTRTWMDIQMNRKFQRTQGVRLGGRLPWIALNYLIVETSLEWHYQDYLWKSKRFRDLPPRSASDRTALRAFVAFQDGGTMRGAFLYAWAMLQNFADPVRR